MMESACHICGVTIAKELTAAKTEPPGRRLPMLSSHPHGTKGSGVFLLDACGVSSPPLSSGLGR